MALKTFVKVSSVNNLSDARYAAGMEVDVLGINIDPLDENYMPLQTYSAIVEWLEGIEIAGEFTLSKEQQITEHLENYNPNYVQIEDPALLDKLEEINQSVILRLKPEAFTDIAELDKTMSSCKGQVTFFLLEEGDKEANSGLLEDIPALAMRYPIVLGFGITPENVNYWATETELYGISLKGGDEIKPGLKDFDEMADILEAIEIDDTV